MAELILMPRLSDTMEEGTVVKWHKNVGDIVSEGDIIAEIETDKAVQEFESEFEGTLLYQGVAEGAGVPVDNPLAVIGQEGEDFQTLIGSAESPTTPTENETDEEVQTETEPVSILDGVEIIQMPRLSDTMETGTVAKWHKNVGDLVSEGDIIAEIETDKAVQEFESEFEGTLLHQGVVEGGASLVDTILAIIGPAGTDVSTFIANGGITTTSNETNHKEEVPAIEVKTEMTVKADNEVLSQATPSSERIFASPLAKKIASDTGIDLKQVQGSGENGRIVKKDVENFTPSTTITETTSTNTTAVTNFMPAGETTETAVSQMRKVIAKRLSESKFTAPHYYLNVEIDMENAMASRKAINAIPDTKISFNDLVIKACATALKKHPEINTTWAGDKIITHGSINIGVAVAVPDGLVVPVVNNAEYLQLTQISATVKELAGRARERKLTAEEMSGSTFTISNLGMFGIESFTSIINSPNSCILSVGAIVEKPIVKNGQIVIGYTMKVTLAADHRIVDGTLGSAFLQTLKAMIENPVTILA